MRLHFEDLVRKVLDALLTYCLCGLYFGKFILRPIQHRNCLQISPNNTLDLKSFNIISGHIQTLEHIFFVYPYRAIMCSYLKHFPYLQNPQVNSRAIWTEHSTLFLQITTSFFTNICSKNIQQSSQCCPLLSRNFRQIVQFRTPVILTLNHEEDSVGFIEMF